MTATALVNNKLFIVGKLTPELLYFCWKKLKKYSPNQNNLATVNYSIPISKRWFKTVPSLIVQGKFSYEKAKFKHKPESFFKLKHYKSSLQVKFRILETAFLYLVKPYFLNYFLFKKTTANLSECLCLIFVSLKYFCSFLNRLLS